MAVLPRLISLFVQAHVIALFMWMMLLGMRDVFHIDKAELEKDAGYFTFIPEWYHPFMNKPLNLPGFLGQFEKLFRVAFSTVTILISRVVGMVVVPYVYFKLRNPKLNILDHIIDFYGRFDLESFYGLVALVSIFGLFEFVMAGERRLRNA